jgi:hypothetical protein
MIYFVLPVWTRFPGSRNEKEPRCGGSFGSGEELGLFCGGFDVLPFGGGEFD